MRGEHAGLVLLVLILAVSLRHLLGSQREPLLAGQLPFTGAPAEHIVVEFVIGPGLGRCLSQRKRSDLAAVDVNHLVDDSLD